MPREFSRSERVADALQRELAQLIRTEVNDPRVDMVNVTGVDVNRDLAVAKVYVSFIDDREDKAIADAVAALNGAAGYLRSQLASRMSMRSVPSLKFFYDRTAKTGQYLSALIDQAIASDTASGDGNAPAGDKGDTNSQTGDQ